MIILAIPAAVLFEAAVAGTVIGATAAFIAKSK